MRQLAIIAFITGIMGYITLIVFYGWELAFLLFVCSLPANIHVTILAKNTIKGD